jgi:hypothetical protein
MNIDPNRAETLDLDSVDENVTGIFIRAKLGEKYGSYDIAFLDAPSLLEYLKSGGGDNPLAENVVGSLLGHGHLHKQEPTS